MCDNIVCGRIASRKTGAHGRLVLSDGKRTTLHAELTNTSATVRCRKTGHLGRRAIDRAWRRRNGHLCWPSARIPHVLGRRKIAWDRTPITRDADCTASRRFKRSSNSRSTTSRVAAYNIYRRRLATVWLTERWSTSDGEVVDLLIFLERAVSSHGGPQITTQFNEKRRSLFTTLYTKYIARVEFTIVACMRIADIDVPTGNHLEGHWMILLKFVELLTQTVE